MSGARIWQKSLSLSMQKFTIKSAIWLYSRLCQTTGSAEFWCGVQPLSNMENSLPVILANAGCFSGCLSGACPFSTWAKGLQSTTKTKLRSPACQPRSGQSSPCSRGKSDMLRSFSLARFGGEGSFCIDAGWEIPIQGKPQFSQTL